MNSTELSKEIEEVIKSISHRIINVGSIEYDNGEVQKIENKSWSKLLTETIEEIEDAIVYLAFLRIKLTKTSNLIKNYETEK